MAAGQSMKHALLRMAANAASILTSDVLNRATSFAVYALVARYLGAFSFGQLSLALTVFYTFQVFAEAGLQTLVTREVAKDRSQTDLYLINGSLIALAAAVCSIVVLYVFVQLMGYATDTATVIVLLSLGLIPYALTAICEAVFQAWERMQYLVYANVPMNIVKVGATFMLLSHGADVTAVCLLLVATRIGIAGLEWLLMLCYVTRPALRLDMGFASSLLKRTATFFGVDSGIAIWSSLNIILLSKLADETAVGYYGAVTQLLSPVMLVFNSIVGSVFPVLCRKFNTGLHQLKGTCQQVVELLVAIALPSAVGLYFVAEPLLLLLYGKAEFVQAAGVLRIMAWDLVLIAVTHGLGQVLLAGMREKITLRIVASNIVMNFVVGVVLIAYWGVWGAAVAAVLTHLFGLIQHYVSVSRLLSALSLSRLVWKPVVASGCLAVYLSALGNTHIAISIVSGASLYSAVFVLLFLACHGGVQQAKQHYQYLWAE